MQSGQISFKTSNSPTYTKVYLGSMEKQLSSRGIFSQELQHCRFSKRFKTKCTLGKQVHENLKRSNYLHVHCSTTAIGQRKEIQMSAFRSPKTSRITQEVSNSDLGPLVTGQEKKTDGIERIITNLKESGILLPMSWWKNLSKCTYSTPRYQCVESRTLEKERWGDVRCTSMRHLRMQSSYFAQTHSANQLSIYGAVASWCEELTQLIPCQTHMSMEKTVAKVNDQLSHKLEP